MRKAAVRLLAPVVLLCVLKAAIPQLEKEKFAASD